MTSRGFVTGPDVHLVSSNDVVRKREKRAEKIGHFGTTDRVGQTFVTPIRYENSIHGNLALLVDTFIRQERFVDGTFRNRIQSLLTTKQITLSIGHSPRSNFIKLQQIQTWYLQT